MNRDVGPAARETGEEHWTRWILALATVVHLAFGVSLLTHWFDPLFVEVRDSYGQAADYFGIYQGGDNLLQGVSIYDSHDYRDEAVRRVPYFYFYRWLPPTAYFMAVQALLFSPWVAYVLWVLFNEFLYLGWVRVLLRYPVGTPGTRRLFAAVVLGFSPFYAEQWMGQFSFVMTLFLWGTLYPEFRGQTEVTRGVSAWRTASFWNWTGSVALKNYPALFAAPFLLQGRFRRVVGAAAVVVAASLPYYLARPADLAHFIHLNLKPVPPTLSRSRFGAIQLWNALSQKLQPVGAEPVFEWAGRAFYFSTLVIYGWYALVVGVTAWITVRRPRRPETLCLWILAFFLIFKDVWEYHHVMLLPVLFLLGVHGPRRIPLLLGLLLALPTPYVFYGDLFETLPVLEWPAGGILLHFAAKAFPVILLYLWTARRALTADPGTRRIGK